MCLNTDKIHKKGVHIFLVPSLTCALEEQIQEIKQPTELDVGKKNEEKEKKRKFVVMPIPISNPTIGTGLGLSAKRLYKVDGAWKITSPELLEEKRIDSYAKPKA